MSTTIPTVAPDRHSFDQSSLVDVGERRAVFAALDSFRQYRRSSHFHTTHRRRQNLYALPKSQWQTLAGPPFSLLDTLNAVDDAIDTNADIADVILELGLKALGLPLEPVKGSELDWHGVAETEDIAKAHSTIRQFYRDWSFEGFTTEVEPLLNIVLRDLKDVFPLSSGVSDPPSLLLPGAGLGRILFALSINGYHVEGNEISYHQLLASNFILNHTDHAEQYKLYPFASTFTNHKSRRSQLREVRVPDIHPATVVALRAHEPQIPHHPVGEMNMTAGDFLTSYEGDHNRNTFDAVVSIYFIDTAPNLARYIEIVRNCLRDGGVWINIGPLLWHFDNRKADSHSGHEEKGARTSALLDQQRASSKEDANYGIGEPGSFELVDEEVFSLLTLMGFEILKQDYLPTELGCYIQDSNSMSQSRYECSHWIAKKLPRATN